MPKKKIAFSNPPLREAVFEIKFKDPNILDYDLFVGELYSKLKKQYPFSENIKPKEAPSILFPFIVQHRFRKIEEGFPLYQLGPGIISFNMDGKTYQNSGKKWKGFKKELLSFLEIFKEVAGENFEEGDFEHFSLRFIDIIKDADMYPEVKPYFTKKLGLKIDLDFIPDAPYLNNLEDSALSQTYNLDKKGKSKLNYTVKTIIENGERGLFLDVAEKSFDPSLKEIDAWLEKSHEDVEAFFLAITKEIKHLFI